jgi:DNA-binding HxlR family transcriptional regulator
MLNSPWPFVPMSRTTDPETSKQAMTPQRAETIAMKVLKCLHDTPNQTCQEIADSMPEVLYRSISPRLIQLERKGLIQRAGAKLINGKPMLSYSITQTGVEKCSQN